MGDRTAVSGAPSEPTAAFWGTSLRPGRGWPKAGTPFPRADVERCHLFGKERTLLLTSGSHGHDEGGVTTGPWGEHRDHILLWTQDRKSSDDQDNGLSVWHALPDGSSGHCLQPTLQVHRPRKGRFKQPKQRRGQHLMPDTVCSDPGTRT